MKILDGYWEFEEHNPQWTKITLKYPKQRDIQHRFLFCDHQNNTKEFGELSWGEPLELNIKHFSIQVEKYLKWVPDKKQKMT